MAIENHLNRRNSTELRDVKGVNYDVEKIKKGLTSGGLLMYLNIKALRKHYLAI